MAAAKPPPEREPKDARFVQWLQRINGQYATIWRWTCAILAVVSFFLKRPEGLTFFGGAAIASLAVGKPKDG